METLTKLNTVELEVLKACENEVISCTGSEFGYTEDVKVSGMRTQQLKGYLSQLVQKGCITSPDREYSGQFKMKQLGSDLLGYDKDRFDVG